MRTFKITLRSDTGRHSVTTPARNGEVAQEIVCNQQLAPRSAVVKVEERFPRLSHLMNNGQFAALVRDFKDSFAGCEDITPEDVANWAIQTRAFYDFYFTRFEQMANKFNAKGVAYSLFPDYRPQFMEWAAHETFPPKMEDCIRGILNTLKFSLNGKNHRASKIVYAHYLKAWSEEEKPRLCRVRLQFEHGGPERLIYCDINQTDEYISGRFVGKKWEDMKFNMERVKSVKIERT